MVATDEFGAVPVNELLKVDGLARAVTVTG
jgi:hypothetical protein